MSEKKTVHTAGTGNRREEKRHFIAITGRVCVGLPRRRLFSGELQIVSTAHDRTDRCLLAIIAIVLPFSKLLLVSAGARDLACDATHLMKVIFHRCRR